MLVESKQAKSYQYCKNRVDTRVTTEAIGAEANCHINIEIESNTIKNVNHWKCLGVVIDG